MRALIIPVAPGRKLALELELHDGVAKLATDDHGQHVRLELGSRDAETVRSLLSMAFPGPAEPAEEIRCEGCTPEKDCAIPTDGIERAHWQPATDAAVRYYLHSVYGLTLQEIVEALEGVSYTVQAAGEQGMTVEEVAQDIARRLG